MKDDHVYPRQTDLGPRPGMELRDWFAGMALQGLLASEVRHSPEDAAIWSYVYAESMLEERSGEQN